MPLGMPFGFLIGVLLGLTGAGGGILAVPALVLGMGWSPQAAAPVALLAVGMSAGVGAFDGLRRGLVRWRAALFVAALGVSCAPLGVKFAQLLPHNILMTLFVVAMFTASGRLLFSATQSARRQGDPGSGDIPSVNCSIDATTGRLRWTGSCAITLALIGSCAGLLSGMLGVGGGFVIVPAFRQWTNVRVHGIVATSLLVIALVSIGAAGSSLLAGAHIDQAGYLFIAAAMAGMFLSRAFVTKLRAQSMQIGFALLSLGVASILFYRTWFA